MSVNEFTPIGITSSSVELSGFGFALLGLSCTNPLILAISGKGAVLYSREQSYWCNVAVV